MDDWISKVQSPTVVDWVGECARDGPQGEARGKMSAEVACGFGWAKTAASMTRTVRSLSLLI